MQSCTTRSDFEAKILSILLLIRIIENIKICPFCLIKNVSFTTKLQVKDAISAVINVDDYGASARLLAATTLRNVLGTKNLGDILSDREAIANDMQV